MRNFREVEVAIPCFGEYREHVRVGFFRKKFVLGELSSLGENQASRKLGVCVPCSFQFSGH